jgi:hypothetical protein
MKKILFGLLLALVLTVTLSACNFLGSTITPPPTATVLLGDKDIQLGNESVTVAGQLANWQGHGISVWVYIITEGTCTDTDIYVKPPQSGKTTQFVLAVSCANGKWIVLGSTDSNGYITAAQPTKLKN